MKVLVLAPHTDDGQFCCGGTAAKMIEDGHEVHEAAFSFASDARLRSEWTLALDKIGVPADRSVIYDFPVRRFGDYRQDILQKLIDENAVRHPDLVLCPSSSDTHQDHQTIREECFRAFKGSSILGYETPWNNIDFRATAFTLLARRHVDAKSMACQQYESQLHRPYAHTEFIHAWARSRGIQTTAEYAEAFEVIRWLM
jgi:LmbE family N-acetylglucosaminyl deacetylase